MQIDNFEPNDLLMDEKYLALSPTLAAVFGVPGALILQEIHSQVRQIMVQPDNEDNFFQNHYWTAVSLTDWQRLLPFVSPSTIDRTLKNLCKGGYIYRSTTKLGTAKSRYRLGCSHVALEIAYYNEPDYQTGLMKDPVYDRKQQRIREQTEDDKFDTMSFGDTIKAMFNMLRAGKRKPEPIDKQPAEPQETTEDEAVFLDYIEEME